ncbi:taste receptor type 2 member 40-like [Hyperolius riggenbachi]|uniref:taste receptor type 2 member 40-like n=1 Tax=Hyperolius riggenbachi TaxID=752182 RepID=UPI0035A302C9
MNSILEVIRLVMGISAGLSGMCLNAWIVAVNAKDWWKGISLSTCDLILSLIGLFNFILQFDMILDVVFTGFQISAGFVREAHLRLLNVVICLVSCNYWFTVWLSTYYCFRIVSFASGVLYILKRRIHTIIPKLLALSVVASVCISIPAFWNMSAFFENYGQNVTTKEDMIIIITPSYVATLMTGTVVPLVLTLLPTAVTLNSLRRHTKKMKNIVSTKAHIRAVKTMVLLIILHMAFYAVSMSILLNSFNIDDTAQYFCWYFVLFHSTLQAIVLIIGNSKMKRAGLCILKQVCKLYDI